MVTRKTVILITFGNKNTPSTWYRALQLIPLLEAAGIEVVTWEKASLRVVLKNFWKLRGEMSRPTIWVQKKILPVFTTWLLARGGKIVFDFDDAIWTTEKLNRSWLAKVRVRTRLSYLFRKSIFLVAGNDYLATYASHYNATVHVVPTTIDCENYPQKVHRSVKKLTLGWIGTSGNFLYLAGLRGVFDRLLGATSYRLLVISDRDFSLPGLKTEIENRRWSKQTEISDLLDIDIGLMPIHDDEWTRGKCAFKAIQYMACGIPAVVSPIPGANQKLVKHDWDGIWADTTDEWVSGILKLDQDLKLRAMMGVRARQKIENFYSQNLAAKVMTNLFLGQA